MADSERVVSTLLDRLVPSFQAVERHSTTIAASSDQVWAAMSQVTTGELMGVRVLPGRLVGSPRARFDADEPLLGWLVRFGFSILGEDVRRELVFGAIAQPWRLAGGRGIAIANGQDFAAFDQPGFANMAANFRLDPITSRAVQLSTETRTAKPTPGCRRADGEAPPGPTAIVWPRSCDEGVGGTTSSSAVVASIAGRLRLRRATHRGARDGR